MEEHDLGGSEDLNWELELVSDELSYTTRKDQNHGHADCDLFSLNDMKHVAKVLGDMMKLAVRVQWSAPFYS